jgi:hypothetical protein
MEHCLPDIALLAMGTRDIPQLQTKIDQFGARALNDCADLIECRILFHIELRILLLHMPRFASLSARQIRSGVSGKVRIRTPVAWKIALPIAGAIETMPDSPIPLAP